MQLSPAAPGILGGIPDGSQSFADEAFGHDLGDATMESEALVEIGIPVASKALELLAYLIS
jgi:hypothetical protein